MPEFVIVMVLPPTPTIEFYHMAEESWRTLGLSSRIQSTSKALADLQRAQILANETIQGHLEALNSEILELRKVVGFPTSPNDFASATIDSSPEVKALADSALETLLDEIPLRALSDAHKRRADKLSAGDEAGRNDAQVYVEYQKCLQLHPGPKDGPEFHQLSKRIRMLERGLSSKGSDDKGGPSAPGPSGSVSAADSKKPKQHGGKGEKAMFSRLGLPAK
ncbi:hypothetical protein B0H11DRAFT_2046400 [Mycena galericulata]|nr:hypothetical protein B0H11DRAFT_2046400 [Mycena galericulata]